MIDAALGGLLLRQVPEALRAGLAAGEYDVFGSVIRNVANGRIVGHLQEAAPLGNLLMGLPGSAVGPVGLLVDLAGLAQGEFIRAGVARVEKAVSALTAIGIGNLALSAAGVGISVVGFSVMAMKIDGLRREVSALGDRLDQLGDRVDQLSRDILDVDFVEVKALAKSYDEAWRLSGAAAESRWHDVARGALSYQSRFEMRADRVLQGGVEQYAVADPLLDAVSMASGLRVAALAACNEVSAAQAASADGARSMERLTGGIGLADLSRAERSAATAKAGTPQWAHAQARANVSVRPTVRKIRLREAAAATRAAPLGELPELGITAREWLETARREESAPFLYLPAGAQA